MTPQAALTAAANVRRTAAAHRMPSWFPAVSASTFTLGMVISGVAQLNGFGSGARSGMSTVGAALIVANLALYPLLVWRWRRSGVIPRADGCVPATRRRIALWATPVAFALSAVVWVSTGSFGWMLMATGVLFGAEGWYRQTGWRQR